MITITRRIPFCAGHRLMGHGGQCAHLHGHNYVAEVTVVARELDVLGMVTDFGEIKTRFKGWIDEHWDHGFLIHEADEPTRALLTAFEARPGVPQKVFAMPINPTAEGMAQYLLAEVAPTLLADLPGIEIRAVRMWETENCWADATIDDDAPPA